MIPLGKPEISEQDIDAVIKVLKSGLVATGNVVEKFEKEFSKYIGRSYGVTVNSGTIALYLSIKASGLKKVIIPSVTCPDVLNAVLNAGASPIVAEVDYETHNLDPEKLSPEMLAEADGLIITNAYGHPSRIEELRDLCHGKGLTFIEDFSQSLGAWYRGQRSGSFGDVSITSFYGPKGMTTGYGGMILTDSEEIYQKVQIARGDMRYEHVGSIIPLNLKITDFQAALGLSQLKRLDEFVAKRRSVAAKYDEALKELPSLEILKSKDDVVHSYYKYAIMLNNIDKVSFIAEMKKKGIQVGSLYDPPLHKSGTFNKFVGTELSLPVSENCAARSVSLPMYPSMSQEDVNKVIDAVTEVSKCLIL